MKPASREAPQQLVLELPHRQALGLEDFLVSRSNAAAVELVDAWPRWENRAVLVLGPKGSGKSHLANVWRSASGGDVIAAAGISDASVAMLEARRALVIEDIDRGVSDETVFFHLLNLAREKGFAILMTSRSAPGDIPITLPDLRSRLRALPLVAIEEPDDGLLNGVLVKLFADRQLAVEPHVISYLALHMTRSMEAASRVVAAIDKLSLARQRRVTRAIAADGLAAVAAETEGE
ncbi:MAG: DnaA/Hda family protein [Hyphomicrobium sp.]|jgi:chromosomal replication initiation ATPase DnaA